MNFENFVSYVSLPFNSNAAPFYDNQTHTSPRPFYAILSQHSTSVATPGKTPLICKPNLPGLLFNLGSGFNFSIPGIRTSAFGKDQYNLICLPNGPLEITLREGEHRTIFIQFSLAYLMIYFDKCPGLKDFMAKVGSKTPVMLSKKPLPATPSMLNKIARIHQNKYKAPQPEPHLNEKILDILVACLEQIALVNSPEGRNTRA
jgi:hypothetical protein